MTLRTAPFDPADYLETPEAVAAYMSEALESGDAAFVADALGVIARAKGMSELARDTGLGRESLYKSLGRDGNPSLDTVLKVLAALKLSLRATPIAA